MTPDPCLRNRPTRRTVALLFRVALRDFSRTNGTYLAAGIAYWAVFSLFPLALAALSITGFLFPSASEKQQIVDAIVKVVPVSDAYLARIVDEVVEARGTLSAIAVAGLLFTGTAVFSAIRRGVNHAWGIGQPHHFLVERALDLVMLIGVGMLTMVVIVFNTNVLGLSTLAEAPSRLPDHSAIQVAVKLFVELGATALMIGVLALLYRYLPNTRVTWRDVWLAAVIAGVLFSGIRIGVAWYVGRFRNFQLVYGSLGAIMAVMAWAYMSSLAIVWGAQVSHVYSRVFGSRAVSDPLPELRAGPAASQAAIRAAGPLSMLMTVVRWLLPPRPWRR